MTSIVITERLSIMSYEADILDIIEKNREKSTTDFLHINTLIRENDLQYKGNFVRTLALPKVLTELRYTEIRRFIKKLYKIFDKVIDHYFVDQSYREMFGFEPKLNELILASKKRNAWIPVARIDFFLNEENGTIKMCEINTDGSSGMNEDRLLGEFLAHNSAFQTFMEDKEYQRFEYFESWVEEFLLVYKAHCKKRKKPRVAIIDFLDVGYVSEFEVFKKAFIHKGFEAEICDIRDLKYDGLVLRTPSGMVVDAIYRRAVTSDIMNKYDEVGDFIKAVKDRAVCLVGDFATQIVHNKRLFFILFHDKTKEILTAGESKFLSKHFPATFSLTDENLAVNKVRENREKWIIKPCDSYGAKGFFAGRNLSPVDWEKVLTEHTKDDYILQEFNAPYKTLNIDFGIENPVVREYSNLTGIFCYNGKPYGAYSRIADGEIISTQYDEKTIATVLIKEETKMTLENVVNEVREKASSYKEGSYEGFLAVQITLTDLEKAFYVEVKEGKLTIEPYEYLDRQANLKITSANFIKMINGKLNSVVAFTTGKLQIDGDISKATEMANILKG